MMLKGEGFIIRSWQPGDAEALAVHANNLKIAEKLLEGFPHPYTLKDAQEWIMLNSCPERQKTFFAIVVDGAAVGGIAFKHRKPPHHKTVILGYWIGERYWNKGITSNAVKLMLPYMFENFDVERVEARVLENNKASAKVLEKNNFLLEGRLRNSAYDGKSVVDELLYSKLKVSEEKG